MHYGPIVAVLLIILFVFYIAVDSQQIREYHKTYYYMDDYINVKLYTKSPKKARTALKELAKIYAKYDALTTQKESKSYKNLYYIKNNVLKSSDILIEKELYEILAFGKKAYEKSNGLLDIGTGSLQRLFLQNKNQEVLSKTHSDIEKVHLQKDFYIDNTKADLYVSMLAKSFANKEAQTYLQKLDIPHYLINTGGNIISGLHYENSTYKIGLEDPKEKGNYYKMLDIKQQAVATKTVHDNIVHPKTFEKPTYHKAVTVVASSPEEAEALAYILFLQSQEEGEAYMEEAQNKQAKETIKVIWYTADNQITEKTYHKVEIS